MSVDPLILPCKSHTAEREHPSGLSGLSASWYSFGPDPPGLVVTQHTGGVEGSGSIGPTDDQKKKVVTGPMLEAAVEGQAVPARDLTDVDASRVLRQLFAGGACGLSEIFVLPCARFGSEEYNCEQRALDATLDWMSGFCIHCNTCAQRRNLLQLYARGASRNF